jgi:hypothetical protein
MSESVTFQAILPRGFEQGRLQEAVALLMKLGRKRVAPPEPKTISLIDGISDLGRIEHLIERLQDIGSWSELLAVEGTGNDSAVGEQ